MKATHNVGDEHKFGAQDSFLFLILFTIGDAAVTEPTTSKKNLGRKIPYFKIFLNFCITLITLLKTGEKKGNLDIAFLLREGQN